MTAGLTEHTPAATAEPAERLRTCVERAIAAVHDLVRELRLTETELHAVVEFLTRVGRAGELMMLSDVTHTSILVDELTHGGERGTPSDVEGPLYRPGAPVEDSPAVLDRADRGEDVLLLRGHVLDADSGEPLPGAMLDIWQADQAGLYEDQDGGQPDYNLRGRVRADAQGGYEVRTVVPSAYAIATTGGPVGELLAALGRHDRRPAHVHVKATAEGHRPLTSQIFLAGDPWLHDDVIGAVKPELVVTPHPCDLPGVEPPRRALRVDFDVVLAPAGE
jgi:protocatechuate 3,4-dioxygenase beta subunit